jgi:hypothetical protein
MTRGIAEIKQVQCSIDDLRAYSIARMAAAVGAGNVDDREPCEEG